MSRERTRKPFEYYLTRQDYLSEIRARDRYRRHRRNHHTREERKLEIRIAISAFCLMAFTCVCAYLALRATFPGLGW